MSKGLKTLKVSEEVWQAVKVEAAKQGVAICDFVTDALQTKLKTSVGEN